MTYFLGGAFPLTLLSLFDRSLGQFLRLTAKESHLNYVSKETLYKKFNVTLLSSLLF